MKRGSVTENSNVSVNNRSQEVGLSRITRPVLRNELGLHPLRIQGLKPLEHPKRCLFNN